LWDLVRRMMSFRGSGVQILNLSLGCYTSDGQPPMALARAVRLLSPDIVIVAAAGNHGSRAENAKSDHPDVTPQTAFWPAAMDDVIAVGADHGPGADGPRPAPFSPRLPWVTVTADGVDVVSDFLAGDVVVLTKTGPHHRRFDGYARWSGTSFAAATVTGEIAALAKPGVPAWHALAELKEQARLKPDGPIRLFSV
jgi:subtilisin family serine protease